MTASVVVLPELLAIILFPGSLTFESPFRDILLYLCVLCGSTIIYRLSPFHPLARFPGPTLNKITQLRDLWVTGAGRFHLDHHELHRKYGPIVRVGA